MSSPRIAPLPISALPAAEALLADACAFDQAHRVAEEKLFAPGARGRSAEPLGAYRGDTLVAVACISERWLRLLAVHPEHRDQGIGTALLNACLQEISAHAKTARTMDQPGNYLSPGIDDRNHETIAWLAKRGFSKIGEACNLLIDLRDNDRVSQEHLNERQQAALAAGYDIARIRASQTEGTAAMLETSFSRGWAFELRRAARFEPAAVHLATERATQQVVAFAAHDGNNQGLGCFGPTGTLEAHRGQGLGAALLVACLLDIQASAHSHAEVAWIGPRDFYDKIAGIESERHFTVMSKELHD